MRKVPTGGAKPRQAVLAEVRSKFIARGYPRLVVFLIVGLSGLTAFAASVLLLGLGLESMAARYLLATVTGYVTFLLFIRVWIALHRIDITPDIPDLSLAIPHSSTGGLTNAGFSGGSSGGGGASHSWGTPTIDLPGLDVAADADDAWPVILAVVVAGVLAIGGLIAIFYVVYAAPVLLAEVALDAALVAGLYRKLRKEDARHWLTSVINHTWKPATIVAACLSAAGWIMQWAVPEALSIGEVIRRVQ